MLSIPFLARTPARPKDGASFARVVAFTLSAPLALALALGLNAPAYAIDAASGETNGLTCFACHGAMGKGTKAIPALAGVSADKTYAALMAFKNGTRPATVMDRISKAYSDEEMRAIADYFAALPAK